MDALVDRLPTGALVDRLSKVLLADGKPAVGLYSLASAVLGLPPSRGRCRWASAVQKAKTRNIPVPESYPWRTPSNRQSTPVIESQDVPRAIHVILCDNDEEANLTFCDDGVRHAISLLMERAGATDCNALDLVTALVCTAAEEKRDQSEAMAIPGLPAFRLRTFRHSDGEIYASVHDFTHGLGADDSYHNFWRNTLCDLLKATSAKVLEHHFPGSNGLTPCTDFVGFQKILTLCVGKSKVASTLAEEALAVVARLMVGDQRLHDEVDANAVAAPAVAREFVLGTDEAARQEGGGEDASARRAVAVDLDMREKSLAMSRREFRFEMDCARAHLRQKRNDEEIRYMDAIVAFRNATGLGQRADGLVPTRGNIQPSEEPRAPPRRRVANRGEAALLAAARAAPNQTRLA